MSKDFILRQAILHILDRNAGVPVLSDQLLDLEASGDYISAHISRAYQDDEVKVVAMVECPCDTFSAVMRLKEDSDCFIDLSKTFANAFFNAVSAWDIPPCDLLAAEFQDGEDRFFAVLKLNYKSSYIHFVNQGECIANTILCQPVALPSASQKIDEFLIFDFAMEKLYLKEKKYSIDGQNQKYISKQILKIPEEKSPKEKLSIVKKTLKNVTEKYYPGDLQSEMDADKAISNEFNVTRSVHVDTLADNISRGIPTIKEEFYSELQRQGVEEAHIELPENLERAVNKKRKIVTEDGIEIKLPLSMVNRPDKFEIINNPDGSLSLLIKNVEMTK